MWLTKTIKDNKKYTVSSSVKKEVAIAILNLHFDRVSENEWRDILGNIYFIEGYEKEY